MKKLPLIFICILVALPGTDLSAQQPPKISGYQLSWFDNFDGTSLDQTKWNAIFSTSPTNNSLHAYLPNNVIVGGGNMVLLSENEPFGVFNYRSGQVTSKALSRYGRFEVRANLPTSQGMWPAIWLLPDQPPIWPSQGEIDIMENRGNQPNLTSSAFHWGTNPPFYHNFVYAEHEMSANGSPLNFHNSFHIYCAEWDPEQIRFYVDGAHLYTVRNENVENFMTTLQTNPMRLVINTAIGGNFLPNPDASTVWPQLFEIDYVWVYDRVGEPTLSIENGDFETNNGSLSNWTLFGNNGQNVSSSDEFSLSGNSSLKVYGQFTGGQNFSGVEQGVSVEPGETMELTANVFINPVDPLTGSNSATLKIDFYSEQYGGFGSDEYLGSEEVDLANASTATGQWIQRQVLATAPAGAAEARAAIVLRQVSNASGAIYVDNVTYGIDSNDVQVHPDVAQVVNGKQLSGTVEDLVQSDDQSLDILAGMIDANSDPMTVVFTATSPEADPSNIEFVFESSGNTIGLTQKLEAWNFNTNAYELVDQRAAATQDNVVSISVNDSAYINAGNQAMLFRASWEMTGLTLFYPWQVSIDQVAWTISD